MFNVRHLVQPRPGFRIYDDVDVRRTVIVAVTCENGYVADMPWMMMMMMMMMTQSSDGEALQQI